MDVSVGVTAKSLFVPYVTQDNIGELQVCLKFDICSFNKILSLWQNGRNAGLSINQWQMD